MSIATAVDIAGYAERTQNETDMHILYSHFYHDACSWTILTRQYICWDRKNLLATNEEGAGTGAGHLRLR